MKQVDLFYLSPNPYGGWVTYTCHLIEALEAVGVKCNLFKIRPKTEKFTRKFGYDKLYRNISMEVALSRKYEKLIVAGAKQFKEQTLKLYKEGDASIVVHDPTELKNLPNPLDSSRCVVIRKSLLLYDTPTVLWNTQVSLVLTWNVQTPQVTRR